MNTRFCRIVQSAQPRNLINLRPRFTNMIDKLIDIKNRFEEVSLLLGQPETVKDQKRFQQLSKEYRDMEKVVLKYNQYQSALDGIKHAKEVLQTEKDAEMRELAKIDR